MKNQVQLFLFGDIASPLLLDVQGDGIGALRNVRKFDADVAVKLQILAMYRFAGMDAPEEILQVRGVPGKIKGFPIDEDAEAVLHDLGYLLKHFGVLRLLGRVGRRRRLLLAVDDAQGDADRLIGGQAGLEFLFDPGDGVFADLVFHRIKLLHVPCKRHGDKQLFLRPLDGKGDMVAQQHDKVRAQLIGQAVFGNVNDPVGKGQDIVRQHLRQRVVAFIDLIKGALDAAERDVSWNGLIADALSQSDQLPPVVIPADNGVVVDFFNGKQPVFSLPCVFELPNKKAPQGIHTMCN